MKFWISGQQRWGATTLTILLLGCFSAQQVVAIVSEYFITVNCDHYLKVFPFLSSDLTRTTWKW